LEPEEDDFIFDDDLTSDDEDADMSLEDQALDKHSELFRDLFAEDKISSMFSSI